MTAVAVQDEDVLSEATPKSQATDTQGEWDSERQRLFAQAVNPRNNLVRIISGDNMSPGAVAWSPDIADQPYAVRLGHRGRFLTLAFDFDAREDSDVETAAFQADLLVELLVAAGISSVTARSGPRGRHVLVTVSGNGLPAFHARELAKGLIACGFSTLDKGPLSNVTEGAIRSPGSPHRHVGRSEVVSAPLGEALRTLQARNDPAALRLLVKELRRMHQPRPLVAPQVGDSTSRLESWASPSSGATSRSELVQGMATSYVTSGRSEVDFIRDAMAAPRPTPVGGAIADRGPRAQAWLSRSYRKAVQFVAENPPRRSSVRGEDRVVRDWREAIAVTGRLPWSARVFADKLAHLAEAQGRAMVGLALREAAIWGGISKDVAADGARALLDLGAIEVAGEPNATTATRYRLLHPAEWAAPNLQTVSPSPLGGVGRQTVCAPGAADHPMTSTAAFMLARDVRSGLWSPTGLGEARQRVYEQLALAIGDEVDPAAIGATLDRSPKRVRQLLNDLAAHGLARKVGPARWVAEAKDARVLVKEIGAEEKIRHRNDRYAREHLNQQVTQLIWRLTERSSSKATEVPSEVEGEGQFGLPTRPLNLMETGQPATQPVQTTTVPDDLREVAPHALSGPS